MVESSSHQVPRGEITPELIQAARDGSPSALEELFSSCRPYLLGVANDEFPQDLKAKAGASDLVQQTFLEAHQNFGRFQGCTVEQLKNWLRRILLNNQANFIRLFRETEMRDVSREEEGPGAQGDQGPVASSASPSEKAVRLEELERLRQAVDGLPDEFRQVVQWRQQDRMTFEEIGPRMNRSADAARKLWARAIERLREVMGGTHDK